MEGTDPRGTAKSVQQPRQAAAVAGTGRDAAPRVTPKWGQDSLAKPVDPLPIYHLMKQMSS